ncbi:MAG: hypothetical protein K2Q34_04665 [Alphaproteobacteria bacterium]|nr:hypothetical protein [Alphaproteobacteria bacterium]
MNKRLLICALLSIGQLVYTSSYVFASALTLQTTEDGAVSPGHMHHKAPSSTAAVVIHDGAKPSAYICVENLAELIDGLSKGTSSAISIQLMRDFTLSDVLTGTPYASIQRLNIGSFAKLEKGDLTLIISAFPNLTKLILGNNAASIPSDELAAELPKLRHLQGLNVAGESVTDDVIEAILPLVGTLHELHLNNTSLTEGSVETLKHFKHLTHLNTLGTRTILREQADAIKAAIPALAVKDAFKRSAF